MIRLTPDLNAIRSMLEGAEDDDFEYLIRDLEQRHALILADEERLLNSLGNGMATCNVTFYSILGDNGESYDEVRIAPSSAFKQHGYTFFTDGVFSGSVLENNDLSIAIARQLLEELESKP